VCPSVRPYVHKKVSDFDVIWCVGDEHQCDLDSMQGHGACEVPKISLF